jgi:phage terminase small subunit
MAKKLTAKQKELYKKLTTLQKYTANAFISGKTKEKSYLIACKKIKRVPAKAPRTAAHGILTNTNVKAYVDSVKQPAEERAAETAIMTREESLQRLSAMARGNIADLLEFGERVTGQDDDGNDIKVISWWFKNSADMTPGNLALINEISAGQQGIKIKIHDAKVAHKQLAQLEGWESATKLNIVAEDEALTPWSNIKDSA